MTNMQQKVKPSDGQKPDGMAPPKKLAGRAALVSALIEAPVAEKPLLTSNFSRVPDQLLGGFTSERELSDQIGAPVRIISNRELRASIGLDPADRFIADAEMEAGKKR